MASHDLKAPIANMEGLINAFTRKLTVKVTLDGEQNQLLSLIHTSIHRLKSTIASLTEIAKAQKEEEDEEVVTISNLVEEVIEDLDKLNSTTGMLLEKHIEENQLKIAPKHLRSILYNLLSNAIKFRSPERPPQIHLTTKREGNYLLLVVEDNGMGIEENHVQKLFTMFKRFHTDVEGTGIGLYIIKRIVENRGGKIMVESTVGEGSTFTVLLPYKL
jgi:signal transduction histidine kinase